MSEPTSTTKPQKWPPNGNTANEATTKPQGRPPNDDTANKATSKPHEQPPNGNTANKATTKPHGRPPNDDTANKATSTNHERPPNDITTNKPQERPLETKQVQKGTSKYCQGQTSQESTCRLNLTFKLTRTGLIACFVSCMFCSREIRRGFHKLEEKVCEMEEKTPRWKKKLQEWKEEFPGGFPSSRKDFQDRLAKYKSEKINLSDTADKPRFPESIIMEDGEDVEAPCL